MSARSTIFGFALLVSGCALQTYEPRPLDPARSQAAFLAFDPNDASLRETLARRGIDVGSWPMPQWDLAALTALAFEMRADLALARAQRAGVDAARQTARSRRAPGLDLTTEHHSVRGSSGSPWTFGIALELPLTGASRQAARLDQAEAKSREAQWQLAQRTWQVRCEVRDAYVAWHFAGLTAAALDAELGLRGRESALLDQRLAVGAVGGVEPARARQREAETARRYGAAAREVERARGKLAQVVGLAPEALDGLALAALPDHSPAVPGGESLQRAALHDRLDVRAALERYAESEAALQLEIARQLPALSIKPGYAWDQGDNRWSLGLSMLLPLLDRNAGPIAEARARREEEAARFNALQARAVAELHAAWQQADAASADLDAVRAAARREAEISARAERRLAAGEADRLDLVATSIASAAARLRVVEAQAAQWRALAALEDAIQRPLDAISAASDGRDGPARIAGNTTDSR